MSIVEKIENILYETIDFTKDHKLLELATDLNMIAKELVNLKDRRIKYRTDDNLERMIGDKHKERNLAHRKLMIYIDKLMED